MSEFTIGDLVKFKYPSSHDTIIGRIKSISDGNDCKALLLYCTDNTGAYTVLIPDSYVVGMGKSESKLEDIKKPARYNKKGKLECWDVILDQEMNFLEGSVLKYLWRYKEKNGIHDLEKAKIYIDKIIQGLKK